MNWASNDDMKYHFWLYLSFCLFKLYLIENVFDEYSGYFVLYRIRTLSRLSSCASFFYCYIMWMLFEFQPKHATLSDDFWEFLFANLIAISNFHSLLANKLFDMRVRISFKRKLFVECRELISNFWPEKRGFFDDLQSNVLENFILWHAFF